MKIKATDLLEGLEADTRLLILETERLRNYDNRALTLQPALGRWSVAQVLEHLNGYGRFYLPVIRKSLQGAGPAVEWFKAGWLGDFFTRVIGPGKDGRVANKMNAPRNHRPSLIGDAARVIDSFTDQQFFLLELLEIAKDRNIGAARTPISISPLIRLKTGDSFRFLVAHNQRHFIQVRNTLQELAAVPRSPMVDLVS